MKPSVKIYHNTESLGGSSFKIRRMEDIYDLHHGQVDEPHRHDYYTIILTIKAQGSHLIDFETYPLSDGQLICISPWQVHQINESQKPTGYAITFTDEFLGSNSMTPEIIQSFNLFRLAGETPPIYLHPSDLELARRYAEDLLRYDTPYTQSDYMALGALLQLILLIGARNCNLMLDQAAQNNQDNGSHLLKGFKDLLEQHFASQHQIAYYAEQLYVSSDHLNRVIKQLTSKTAKQMIQARIVLAAKRMLRFSDMNIKQVGIELGFDEPAHFSTFFKNTTGRSPSDFKTKSHI